MAKMKPKDGPDEPDVDEVETETVEEVAPVVPEAPVLPTAEEQAVIDAKAKVAEAQKTLDEAAAVHADAVGVQKAAEVAAAPKPEKGKHIFIEGTNGTHLLRDAPAGYDGDSPDRRITLGGVNYEHVSDHASGIWVYRHM